MTSADGQYLTDVRRGDIVVAIDGSRSHLTTVDIGVAEAVRRHAPLRIVHVWPGRYAGAWRTVNPVPTEGDGRRLLDMAARHAHRAAPNLQIATDLANGSAAGVLARYSRDARLVVIGRRDGLLTRPGWGSTATYLAHHGACPLLVHRGATFGDGPVVAAVSARATPTGTVASAYEEAALGGSKLVAVHVWSPPADEDAAGRIAVAISGGSERQAAERCLAEALAGWRWTFPDVVVDRLLLREADVPYTLDRASRRGRLLVAGTGADGRFAEMMRGVFGPATTSRAGCPVLLVPESWRHPLDSASAVGAGRRVT